MKTQIIKASVKDIEKIAKQIDDIRISWNVSVTSSIQKRWFGSDQLIVIITKNGPTEIKNIRTFEEQVETQLAETYPENIRPKWYTVECDGINMSRVRYHQERARIEHLFVQRFEVVKIEESDNYIKVAYLPELEIEQPPQQRITMTQFEHLNPNHKLAGPAKHPDRS